jgi:hypothetical protein
LSELLKIELKTSMINTNNVNFVNRINIVNTVNNKWSAGNNERLTEGNRADERGGNKGK